MYYVMRILNILNNHRVFVLSALFAALLVFGIVNWAYDPYRKSNAKLKACVKGMRAYPSKVALYMAMLPADYRRQWRAFVNCKTDKPSLVFEFVPQKKRVVALWLLIAASVATTFYVAVFALVSMNFTYIVLQVVFWLAFTIILLVERVIARHNVRRAKQLFGQMVAQLTACTPASHTTVVEDTVTALKKLNKADVTDETVGKACELLRNKGLDGKEPRTTEEQRRINVALNGLLQAYAKNAARKSI